MSDEDRFGDLYELLTQKYRTLYGSELWYDHKVWLWSTGAVAVDFVLAVAASSVVKATLDDSEWLSTVAIALAVLSAAKAVVRPAAKAAVYSKLATRYRAIRLGTELVIDRAIVGDASEHVLLEQLRQIAAERRNMENEDRQPMAWYRKRVADKKVNELRPSSYFAVQRPSAPPNEPNEPKKLSEPGVSSPH